MQSRFFEHGTLDSIASKHGTDKAHSGHDYMRFYEFFLKRFTDQQFLLLELGVGPGDARGASLYSWRDYFPKAEIVGVDITPESKAVETGGISVEIGDCSDIGFLDHLSRKYSPLVIIDDASHLWSHQILGFEKLFPSLRSGGVFIVEDLHTSFEPLRTQLHNDACEDGFSYFSRLAWLVGGNGLPHPSFAQTPPSPMLLALARQVDAVCFYKHTVLIVKK